MKKNFRKDIGETVNMLFEKRMRKLIPVMIWSALSLATFAGSFVTLMSETMNVYPDWNENDKLEWSLFAMIPLGIG